MSCKLDGIKLNITPEKTITVTSDHHKEDSTNYFAIEVVIVQINQAIKYLRVFLHSKLTLNENINQAIQKAQKSIA